MKRFSWGVALVILSIVAVPLAGLIMTPTTVSAEPLAPAAVTDEEIILIDDVGRLKVDDPFTPAGIKKVEWNSGGDVGWSALAAGDMNGDTAAEIVAIGNNRLKVFDPVVLPGFAPVGFEYILTGERLWRLIGTADFDGDGRDEIIATHDEPNSNAEVAMVFDGGANGTTWVLARQFSTDSSWQALATGDVNGDGYSDLTFVRDHFSNITTYSGRDWSVMADRPQEGQDWSWTTLAIGRIATFYVGNQIALSRINVGTSLPSVIYFRVSGNQYVNLVDNTPYVYNPPFTSLSLGDFNADTVQETAVLRDPGSASVSLLVINPTGQPMRQFQQATGSGSSAYRQVRCGDLDGDGKDEIVIIRSDRYRIYTRPATDDSYVDIIGNLTVPPTAMDTPAFAIANVDGPGVPAGPTLKVDPQSLTFNLPYAGTSPAQNVSITNVGGTGSLPWLSSVVAGSNWLRLSKTSGGTPDSLGISVNSTAVRPDVYVGTIRITAQDPTAINPVQDITVNLTLTDPGFIVLPTEVALMQQIGGPLVQKRVAITRPSGLVPWVATAVPMPNASTVLDAIAKGKAQVSAQGVTIDGVSVPPPSWLSFTPDTGTAGSTPTIMTISAVGTTPGKYSALILIVAQDPNVADPVITVDVSAVIADQIYEGYIPLVLK